MLIELWLKCRKRKNDLRKTGDDTLHSDTPSNPPPDNRLLAGRPLTKIGEIARCIDKIPGNQCIHTILQN